MHTSIPHAYYKVGIYIRLSKEDVDKGYDESESIINQKNLLTEYVKNLGLQYELVDYYIDSGYTGTNFNRPDFQRMKKDIENNKINMVITKDLSRLGRDYIETGEYIEKWFPNHDVRYVSVTDGIDTSAHNNGNNDIAPFKSILNDMYSKDLSKKIRTALHTMQKQGKWVGGKTAIGYSKSPNDKNKLIICEHEAKIVRKIFELAIAGNTVSSIRDYLNFNNIPTANQLRYNKATLWENKTIKNILQNSIYIGTTIQNKTSRISYKNRKIKPNSKEEWNTVENTHEPIIKQEIFDTVQKMAITQKYGRNVKNRHFLLEDLLICYECKHKIGVKVRKDGRYSMVCNNYRRNSKMGICSSHGFNYEVLENQVIVYIKNLFNEIDTKKIESFIVKNRTKHDYSKMIQKTKKEIELIKNNIDNIYIDKLNHKISEEMYNRLLIKLKCEIKSKEKEYKKIKEVQKNNKNNNPNQIKNLVRTFLNSEKISQEFLKLMINKIEIHQNKQVDITFNFNKINSIVSNDETVGTIKI